MDPIKILNDIKDKVLDAHNYDLLKHTYELQNENIKQLEKNNEALKANNKLLQKSNATFAKEYAALKKKYEALEKRIPPDQRTEPSKPAQAVLDHLLKMDLTNFNSEEMVAALSLKSFSRIQVEAGIVELRKTGLIQLSGVFSAEHGAPYYITAEGKQYLMSRS
jgi:predicted nuclease with TOPRIM domain